MAIPKKGPAMSNMQRKRPLGHPLFTGLLGAGTLDLNDPASCIGCGCTDAASCPEGCSWLGVNRLTKRGVCSNCPDKLAQWKAKPV